MRGAKGRSYWRKKLREGWRRWSWIAIASLAVAAVLLGYVGYREYFEDAGVGGSRGDALYRALQLFALEGGAVDPVPWQLQIARVLAPLVTVLAVLGAIVAIFREQLQTLRLRRMRGHAVVCGLGARGLRLAEGFAERGDVVVIVLDPAAEGAEECRNRGLVVLIGDATDRAMLARARLHRARYLIVAGDDDRGNAEIAAEARELLANRRNGRLEAFVHVVDIRLCNLLRERERGDGGSDSYKLRFFNVFETGARAWLREHPPFGEPAKVAGRGPHLFVVGVGRLGKRLVIGAVRSWLSLQIETDTRPRITLIDRKASKEREWLRLAHPQLERFCKLDAVDVDVTTPTFERCDFLLDPQGRCNATTIYVCFEDDALSLEAALTLDQRLGGNEVPIVVRVNEYRGLAALLGRASVVPHGLSNLHVFHLFETCTPEFLLGETTGERLAKAIHERYRRNRRDDADRKQDPRERAEAFAALVNDPAMADWEELPEGLQESNRRQADHNWEKLAALGCVADEPSARNLQESSFSREEIDKMARMEHDRWVAERRFEGWTDGPRDHEAKTTPHLVSWDKLPAEIRQYDVQAVEAMPALFREAGLAIYRRPPQGARGAEARAGKATSA